MRPFLILTSLITAQLAIAAESPVAQMLGQEFLAQRFQQLDRDHDGRLSKDEAKSVAAYVGAADADGDGYITADELRSYFRSGAGVGLQVAVRKLMAAAVGGADIEGQFKKLDRNGDGKLAGDELAQPRWLSRLDTNGDGSVTLEEARAVFATLGAGAGKVEPADAAKPAPPIDEASASPRQEPRQIKPSDAGVGRLIPDLALRLVDGTERKLSDFTGGKATVIALVSTDCPVSKRYLPSLAALGAQVKATGSTLLLIAPDSTDTPEALKSALSQAGLSAPCALDHDWTLSRALQAAVSTDVFVLDAKRTVTYHGALDDQYGLGYSLDAPRHRYVADALAATLAGRVPAVQATEAPGCALDLGKTTVANTEVTYHGRVSRILQANCLECHRAGGVAPFALETPEQVTAKAGMIRKMVERKLMPPWFAAPTPVGQHNPWGNDRSLNEADRADLLAWLAAGRPLGNPADAPVARTWPTEWQIGTPDAVFQIPQPIAVKATGTMPYQIARVETKLTASQWVQAFEVKPTAREVVHHVLIFVREPNGARAPIDEAGEFFAAYVPGNDHVIYPDGFAKQLPANSTLVFQIHYTPTGTAVQEQVKLGVRFAQKAPEHVIQVAGIRSTRLNIPPGADNHPESASITVPNDVAITAFLPHMHLRGKAFRYDVRLPDGTERTLLDIPRYDFNWQLSYRYADPVRLPVGTTIRATGWFDNSAGNPANPDPTKMVHWGPQTTDEMMLGYIEYFRPGETPKLAGR